MSVYRLLEVLRAPEDPQWWQMDKQVFHEQFRYKILLWDDLAMGKLGVRPMEGAKGISDDLRHVLVIF